MNSPSPIPGRILGLLEAIATREQDGEVLIAQARRSVVTSFTDRWIDIKPDERHSPLDRQDGPLPSRPLIVDDSGSPLSLIIVWIERGHLTAIEQAWFADVQPIGWPDKRSIIWEDD